MKVSTVTLLAIGAGLAAGGFFGWRQFHVPVSSAVVSAPEPSPPAVKISLPPSERKPVPDSLGLLAERIEDYSRSAEADLERVKDLKGTEGFSELDVTMLRRDAVKSWALKDPLATLAAIDASVGTEYDQLSLRRVALESWATRDPSAACRWGASFRGKPFDFLSPVIASYWKSDPDAALTALSSIKKSETSSVTFDDALEKLLKSKQQISTGHLQRLLDMCHQQHPSGRMPYVFVKLLVKMAEVDASAAEDQLEKQIDPAEFFAVRVQIALTYSKGDWVAARKWLIAHDATSKDVAMLWSRWCLEAPDSFDAAMKTAPDKERIIMEKVQRRAQDFGFPLKESPGLEDPR